MRKYQPLYRRQEGTDTTEGKEQHWCLAVFLSVGIILNAFALLLAPLIVLVIAYGQVDEWYAKLLLVLGVFNIVCLIALFKWKKWGFYGAVVSGLLWSVVFLAEGFIPSAVLGLVYIVALYGVLQLGGDKSGWRQLE